jgi:acetone carboxylase gamma subunit
MEWFLAVFRQFCCPGCGALIENEIARADDPVLRDIELRFAHGVGILPV